MIGLECGLLAWRPALPEHNQPMLYLNITNRCPNRCYFCIRNFADGVGGFNLRLKREPAVSEVIKALEEVMNRRFWAEVVFCGFGEPTERLDCILEVSRWLKRYF
ncbi:hypothetical protein B6U84_05695, partial [Candidatus Bathyarchaeota archaeon ex4484_40]